MFLFGGIGARDMSELVPKEDDEMEFVVRRHSSEDGMFQTSPKFNIEEQPTATKSE